jgi:hypothetical protein
VNSHVWVVIDLHAKDIAEALKGVYSSKGKARAARDKAGEDGSGWVIWLWEVNDGHTEETL